MTVSNQIYRNDYSGNDVLVTFDVDFFFIADEHLKVVIYNDVTEIETEQVLNTDYSVADAGEPTGGSITFLITPPTSDETITIVRNVPLTQLFDYIENDNFPAESHEQAIDLAVMTLQQFQEQLDRAVISAISSEVAVTLPAPNAGKALLWNAGADDLENSTENFNDIVPDAQAAQAAAEVAQAAAEVAQTAAETAETNAETAETGAEAAGTKAKEWAENPEDVEVETGEYSALHWAAKALAANAKGAALLWFTDTPPSGFLECDGSSLNRVTYSDLFAIIGVTYGNVDGNTFNLPDLRGEVPRGWDHGAGVDPDAASRTDRGDGTTGNNVGTKQDHEQDAHTHGDSGNHNHTVGCRSGSADSPISSGISFANDTDIDGEEYGRNSSPNSNNSNLLASNTHEHTSVGGNETRMINSNVMFIIKY